MKGSRAIQDWNLRHPVSLLTITINIQTIKTIGERRRGSKGGLEFPVAYRRPLTLAGGSQ